jgi:hypothetical protein
VRVAADKQAPEINWCPRLRLIIIAGLWVDDKVSSCLTCCCSCTPLLCSGRDDRQAGSIKSKRAVATTGGERKKQGKKKERKRFRGAGRERERERERGSGDVDGDAMAAAGSVCAHGCGATASPLPRKQRACECECVVSCTWRW